MRVMVGVPCTNSLDPQLVRFLLALHKPLDGNEFEILLIQNRRPIPHARNVLVYHFIRSKADVLLSIDSDMTPALSALRILKYDAPIVSALSPSWGNFGLEETPRVSWNCVKRDEAGNYLELTPKASTVSDCDLAGFSFIVVRREVFADSRMMLPGSGRAWFKTNFGLVGNVEKSEDYDFCERARQNGYRILVDRGIVIGHQKGPINLLDIAAGKPDSALETPMKPRKARRHVA